MNPLDWPFFWKHEWWPAIKRRYWLIWNWLVSRWETRDGRFQMTFNGDPFEPGDVLENGHGFQMIYLGNGWVRLLPKRITFRERINRWSSQLGRWLNQNLIVIPLLIVMLSLLLLWWAKLAQPAKLAPKPAPVPVRSLHFVGPLRLCMPNYEQYYRNLEVARFWDEQRSNGIAWMAFNSDDLPPAQRDECWRLYEDDLLSPCLGPNTLRVREEFEKAMQAYHESEREHLAAFNEYLSTPC